MITTDRTKYMIREVKSNAKQNEFGVKQEDYPHFQTDFRDLDYSAVFALSKYVEAVVNRNSVGMKEYFNDLTIVAKYFDSATNIIREYDYSIDYMLLGACTYFLMEDFGNSLSLINALSSKVMTDDVREAVYTVTRLALGLSRNNNSKVFSYQETEKTIQRFELFLKKGENFQSIYDIFDEYKQAVIKNLDIYETYYIDILFAILKQIEKNSTWFLLPQYSQLHVGNWETYLRKKSSLKILWSAQKEIGESGILSGKSGVIQLPTGVGKTKSLQLIIRSAYLSNRTNSTIVIAPLRSLCSEIKMDLEQEFGNKANINLYSDVLQEDYDFIANQANIMNIVVCTPEKMKYILHHKPNFLSDFGLYIFDEGHLFDDPSRGVAYELLVTTIRSTFNFDDPENNKQCVFVSAVMTNAKTIGKWLFDDYGVLVSNTNIKTTEKSIGLVSLAKRGVRYYPSGATPQESYYVQNIIDIQQMKTPTGRESKKTFPENTTKDITLYLTNRLVKNGAVAIFINNKTYIRSYIKRLIYIYNAEIKINEMINSKNDTEFAKMIRLISIHYGDESEYAFGVAFGVLPHYRGLEEGVKISVEYALRKKLAKIVVCTSTLAQGVNIPIKYLLITSFDGYQRTIKARELQNIAGRIARSGMHTEGSLIVTDTKLNEPKNRKMRNEKFALFDPVNSEPCDSHIRDLVKPFEFHEKYKKIIIGDRIINQLRESININVLKDQYLNECEEKLNGKMKEDIINRFKVFFESTQKTIEAIESHFIFLLTSYDYKGDELNEISNDLCKNTLAYALSTEEERKMLLEIFSLIANYTLESISLQYHIFNSKTMIGIDKTLTISKWIDENIELLNGINLNNMSEINRNVLNLLYQLEIDLKYPFELVGIVLNHWIQGKTLIEIQTSEDMQESNLSIFQIEDICRGNISYGLSFLVGNIIDIGQEQLENIKDDLMVYQKFIKYGLNNNIAINIYELGLSDRHISQEISQIIGLKNLNNAEIIESIKYHSVEIFTFLDSMPSCFKNTLDQIFRLS